MRRSERLGRAAHAVDRPLHRLAGPAEVVDDRFQLVVVELVDDAGDLGLQRRDAAAISA